MTKHRAIELAGGVLQLATLLGITRPAIYQWKIDVPMMRVYQLKAIRPEWF
jgi:DNA-binding transcriptional regulator YdaS (Cro superfamily)